MNEGDIHITVTMPSAVSLERGAEVLRETRLALLKFPEVKDVLTEQGHPEDGTDDEAPNQAETFVIMKPESEWQHRRAAKEQIVDAMRAELEQRPGVDYNFSQPIKDRVEESISGIRGQIVVKIYGEDLQPDAREAGGGRSASSTRDARLARRRDLPRGQRAAHRRRHRSRGGRRATACRCATSRTRSRARYGGQLATSMWEGERKVGVRVKLPIAHRGRSGVGRPARDPGRARARCRWRRWPACTSTAAARRSTASRAAASWRSSATSKAATWAASSTRRRRASQREVKLPEGYYLTWGGEFENQRRAMKRLAVIVPISVLVIFFLLYMTFRAALPALVVLLDVPFATVGGVFALYLTAHRAVGVGGGRVHHAVRRGGHGRRAAHHLRAAGARAARPRQPRTRSSTRCRSGCGRC